MIIARRCLGKYEEPFDVYKIRTMRKNADDYLHMVEENGRDSLGKIKNDPRVTLIGKLLRRYWVDEMPQLYNIKRGEMKWVGVRPHPREEWERRFPKELMDRALQQKPGLFGVNYAFPQTSDFKDKIKNLEKYLNDWEVDPEETEWKYFCSIIKNVSLNGVRSK